MTQAWGEEEAMGRRHKHTWCPHPPGGRWRQSWDEVEWDEDAMATNINTNSQDTIEDLKFFLNRDKDYRNSEGWPELVEWCNSCPEVRKVKFVFEEKMEEKEEEVSEIEKVQVNKEDISEQIMVIDEKKHTEKEEHYKEKGERNEKECVVVEELVVMVGETTGELTVECSREACTIPTLAASAYSTQLVFWRPWEDNSSTTTVGGVEGVEVCSSEATALSSLPVTPPVLVTPQRGGRRRGEVRSEQRLLAFQFKLQEERGLPPSRRQMEEEELRKLGESEPASPTFLSVRRKRSRGVCGATTPITPVSHRTERRRGVPTFLTFPNI